MRWREGEGNKVRKGSKSDWLPLSFKTAKSPKVSCGQAEVLNWSAQEEEAPEPSTHYFYPTNEGEGAGKQQERSGSDQIRPYPESETVP